MPKFSMSEALSFGWDTFKKNWKAILPVVLVIMIVNGIISKLATPPTPDISSDYLLYQQAQFSGSYGFWNLISMLVSIVTTAVFVKFSLSYVDGTPRTIKQMFEGISASMILKLIGASILYILIVGIGFVLLVIPGIYFALRFSQANNVIIDKDAGIMDAFKQSSDLTAGVKVNLFIFGLVCALVMVLGFLALVVGILVAAPVVMLAYAFVYRQLTKTVSAPAAA